MTTLKKLIYRQQILPTLKFLIPYLDIVCLVCIGIVYKNAYTYSVNHIGCIYIARLLINILTGIFIVIYISHLKSMQNKSVKTLTFINLCVLLLIVALPYINVAFFSYLANCENHILIFIGINLYFLFQSKTKVTH